MKKLLQITGSRGVGKDTLFNAIKAELAITHPHILVERFAFADALKVDLNELAYKMFRKWVVELSPSEKEIFRPIMIAYGCACRAIDPDYWVKRVENGITVLDMENEYSEEKKEVLPIITDYRFLNEYQYFVNKYGKDVVKVVSVERNDGGAPTPTEEELKNIPLIEPTIDFHVQWHTVGDKNIPNSEYIKNYARAVIEMYVPYPLGNL